MKKILLILTLIVTCFSTNALSMNRVESDKIFKFTTNTKPLFTVNLVDNNIEYIVGAANSDFNDPESLSGYIFKIANVGNKWVVVSKQNIDEEHGNLYCDEENDIVNDILIVNNNKYIYFECRIFRMGTMYNNSLMYGQYIYDFSNGKLNILELEKFGDDDLDYVNISAYNDKTYLINIFNDKAKKSKIISDNINTNTDVDSPDNFIKKFKITNKKLYDNFNEVNVLDKNLTINEIIFTYYKKNTIHDLFKEKADITSENNNYKVSANGLYLIALDKKFNNDIVLFSEQQGHNCFNCTASYLEIINDDIYVSWGETDLYSSYYIINIKNKTISILSKELFENILKNNISGKTHKKN